MSSLLGAPGERLPLSRVIDALGSAARQVGRPGLIWLAGLLYPGITFTFVSLGVFLLLVERATDLQLIQEPQIPFPWPMLEHSAIATGPTEFAAMLIGLSPILLLFFRWITGLACLSAPDNWAAARGERPTPRLRDAWQLGKGITRSGFGMWLTMLFLNVAALLFLLGPTLTLAGLLSIDRVPPILALVLAPVLLVLLAYALVLEVLMQLGLHSLARNRRGVGSALMHAWRLVRAEPWAVTRAALVDVAVQLAVHVLWQTLLWLVCCTATLSLPVGIAMLGYTGTVRAAFWAQVYRRIGGLSPADGVPGLVPGEEPDEREW